MSRIAVKETEVFSLTELSEKAQQAAHQKWVEMDDGEPWRSWVYDEFDTICNALGIELDQKPYTTVGGHKRHEPAIWYSGFWSQSDGACFEGTYRYAKGAVQAITKHRNDAELIRIATELQRIQAQHFYRLQAVVKQRGHYMHRFCTDIFVCDRHHLYRDVGDAEKEIAEALRDLMLWLYRELESAYEDAVSFESFKEWAEANEREFTEDGRWYV